MTTPTSLDHDILEPNVLLALRPEEAAKSLRISRSRIYELIQSGEIESIKIGRSRRIPVEGLRSWMRRSIESKG